MDVNGIGMTILLFKLLITPLFIGAATLAGRRWGPVVNGLVVGLPLTTGPISIILANEYGSAFATRAAAGSLAGQVSMCAFCLVYSLMAQRAGWALSAAAAISAFLATTVTLNGISWALWPAFGILLTAILVTARLVPSRPTGARSAMPPAWDLPARIGVATTFVVALTTIANSLGPQLSGLLSTFPIFGVVFAAFTHAQQGPQAASNLLRGIVFGSVAYACFFLTIGLGLPVVGVWATYSLALLVALAVSGLMYLGFSRGPGARHQDRG